MTEYAYRPGDWAALAHGGRAALLDPQVSPEAIGKIWELLRAGEALESWLEVLAGNGLAGLPAFGLLEPGTDGVRVVVRGEVVALIDSYDISAGGMRTWREHVAADAHDVTLQVASGTEGDRPLPLLGGIVLASALSVGAASVDGAGAVGAVGVVDVLDDSGSADGDTDGAGSERAAADEDAVAWTSSADAGEESPAPLEDADAAAQPVADDADAAADADAPAPPAAPDEAGDADPADEADGVDGVGGADGEAGTDEPWHAPDAQPTDSEPWHSQADEHVHERPEEQVPGDQPEQARPDASSAQPEPEPQPEPESDPLAEAGLIDSLPWNVPGGAPAVAARSTTEPLPAPGADVVDHTQQPGVAEGAAPDAGDHDGHTVMVSDLAQLQAGAPQGEAPVAPVEPIDSPDDATIAPFTETSAPDPAPAFADERPRTLQLALSTGQQIGLATPALIGRAPEAPRFGGAEVPQLVVVPSPQQDISRTHVEVRAEGDHLLVTDLRSTNGTVVVLPGAPPRRLHPGESVPVPAGTVIDLGDGVTAAVTDQSAGQPPAGAPGWPGHTGDPEHPSAPGAGV